MTHPSLRDNYPFGIRNPVHCEGCGAELTKRTHWSSLHSEDDGQQLVFLIKTCPIPNSEIPGGGHHTIEAWVGGGQWRKHYGLPPYHFTLSEARELGFPLPPLVEKPHLERRGRVAFPGMFTLVAAGMFLLVFFLGVMIGLAAAS